MHHEDAIMHLVLWTSCPLKRALANEIILRNVQLELDLPDEGPGLREQRGIVSGDARRLREFKLDANTEDIAPFGRQLQSTTQVGYLMSS